MINEKNKFLTVSWLSGLLSAEIFISTGEWGVQIPPLTSENSHFLRSGPQEAILVMNAICKKSSILLDTEGRVPLTQNGLSQLLGYFKVRKKNSICVRHMSALCLKGVFVIWLILLKIIGKPSNL